MEIRWLEDFIALARTRNFSRAADDRNVTQPTLSRRIKLVEEEMGVTLIDRNTLPLSLTAAGEVFLASAEQISRIHHDAKSRCKDILEQQSNRLTFAATQSLCLGFWKSWLMPLAGDLDVDMVHNLKSTTWMGADFVEALSNNECDLVLCYWHPTIDFLQPLADERFEHLLVCQEQLVPVTALDDNGKPLYQLPGSKRHPVPFIGYHDNAFLKPVIRSFLQRREPAPHLLTMNENVNSVSAKAMVKEGFGLGWLPTTLLEDNFRYNRLDFAADQSWNIPVEIRLYRSRLNQNQQLQKLWPHLQRTLPLEKVSLAVGDDHKVSVNS